MTALKPIENRRVRGVASETYPVNRKCAHPDCTEDVKLRKDGTPTVHHIFPRSLTKSSSYFVEIMDDVMKDGVVSPEVRIIPHATGLCGDGTTGHHGDVEEHRAWIKLEEGVYNWYVRDGEEWVYVGPLNPQPGSQEGKPKRKRFKGEARRKRKVISVRVPDDAEEDGAALLDEAVETLEERINPGNHRPVYHTIMDGLNYAVLNSDASDFE